MDLLLAYAAVISKIQQVSASSARSLLDKLEKMHLLQEPGQDVELLGSKVIEKTRGIQGSGLVPTDFASILAACFIDSDLLAFKLGALSFFDAVTDNSTTINWEEIVRQLKQRKYHSLLGQILWDSQKCKPPDTPVFLDGLQASINKLEAQVTASGVKPPPGAGGTLCCYTCWTSQLNIITHHLDTIKQKGTESWRGVPTDMPPYDEEDTAAVIHKGLAIPRMMRRADSPRFVSV